MRWYKAPTIGAAVLAVGFSGMAAKPAAAQILFSNVAAYGTDNTGAFPGGNFWDTVAGGGTFDVFIAQGTTPATDPILNSAVRQPAINLVAGVYNFSLFLEPGAPANGGINLYFNNSTAPAITAWVPVNAGGTTPNMTAAGKTIYDPYGAQDPAPGSLSFASGGLTATLTALKWNSPSVFAIDRVGQAAASPSGANDYVVQFTLNVTGAAAVPEPNAVAMLLGTGVMGTLMAVRRRRR